MYKVGMKVYVSPCGEIGIIIAIRGEKIEIEFADGRGATVNSWQCSEVIE